MTAEYTTSLLYSGNPYVEALPAYACRTRAYPSLGIRAVVQHQ